MVVNETVPSPHVAVMLTSTVLLPIFSLEMQSISQMERHKTCMSSLLLLNTVNQEAIGVKCKISEREDFLSACFVLCYCSHFTFTSFENQNLLNVQSDINGNLTKYWHRNGSFPKEYKITLISY